MLVLSILPTNAQLSQRALLIGKGLERRWLDGITRWLYRLAHSKETIAFSYIMTAGREQCVY